MKNILITIILLMHLASGLVAQHIPAPKKMTEFSFITGEWQGKGTYYTQQGINQFEVIESVAFAADSTILLIQGKGFDSVGVKHHDAIGVMYFDQEEIRMHAFTMQGQNVIASVSKTGASSFDWGFELPNGGKIKYSTVYTETTWEESGTYTTPDGSQSFPTMKMSLTRK